MLNPKRKSDEGSGESRAKRRVEEVEVEGVKDENGVVLIPTAGELMEAGDDEQERLRISMSLQTICSI